MVAVRGGQPNLLFQSVHVDHRNSIVRFIFFKQLIYYHACQSTWPSQCLSSHKHPNQTWGVQTCCQVCKHNSIAFLHIHLLALHFLILHQFCACSGRQVFFCCSLNHLSEFPFCSKSLKAKPPCLKLCMVSSEDQYLDQLHPQFIPVIIIHDE